MNPILQELNKKQLKENVPEFAVGDAVKVHVKIVEGEKERIQIFAGTVIARSGSDINASFTVRRVAFGEGVERVFPLHSPRIADVERVNEGDVRRAKLYYLRDRVGKKARVKTKYVSKK
ncbi:MAG: 50S ribosomal protein L19 [Lentisphaeria bacterium]|nr:50S ribosomal protein L19 [Lentisphaeria bacterium]NQZ71236.1 50S ribosomal protein L19 [Lentisphaeria bacterium]